MCCQKRWEAFLLLRVIRADVEMGICSYPVSRIRNLNGGPNLHASVLVLWRPAIGQALFI